jgi:hypothetical protein
MACFEEEPQKWNHRWTGINPDKTEDRKEIFEEVNAIGVAFV